MKMFYGDCLFYKTREFVRFLEDDVCVGESNGMISVTDVFGHGTVDRILPFGCCYVFVETCRNASGRLANVSSVAVRAVDPVYDSVLLFWIDLGGSCLYQGTEFCIGFINHINVVCFQNTSYYFGSWMVRNETFWQLFFFNLRAVSRIEQVFSYERTIVPVACKQVFQPV